MSAASIRQSASTSRPPGAAAATLLDAHGPQNRRESANRNQPAALADAFTSSLQHDFGDVNIHRNTTPCLQPKLKIGAPDDTSEREADAVADQVMRSPETFSSDGGEVSLPCPDCATAGKNDETIRRQAASPFSMEEGLIEAAEEQEEEEDGATATPGEAVQAKPTAGQHTRASAGVAGRIQTLRAGGEPLPGALRSFMEPRFGHDFGKVRVHTGSMASETARSINARAFTFGRDVVFGRGQFSPASADGRRLIAHELTHVVQQGHALPLAHDRMTARRESTAEHRPAAAERMMREAEDGVIRRVVWSPNKPTGKVSHPWGSRGPAGKVFTAATDAGTPLDIWRPNNGKTYWCHGYTFGGSTARGGPYSIWGSDVPTVLKDDGWQQTYSCMAQPADVLVFWDDKGKLTHSGIIRRVSAPGGRVDDAASTLESKWGPGPHNTTTWATNAKGYGKYRCYSKAPLTGVCSGKGANEI